MARTISGHPAHRSRSPWLATRYVPGRPIWLRTDRRALPLFLRLCVLLDQVEPLKLRNTWSYNYRPNAIGGGGISDHAGWAIDCWSDGIGRRGWPPAMTAKQATAISDVLERFKTADGRHVFGWGAVASAPGVTYTGPTYSRHSSSDPMHFFVAPGITPRDLAEVRKAMRIMSDGTVK